MNSRNSKLGARNHTNSSRGSILSNASSRRKQAFTSVALHKGSTANRPAGYQSGSRQLVGDKQRAEARMRNTEQQFNSNQYKFSSNASQGRIIDSRGSKRSATQKSRDKEPLLDNSYMTEKYRPEPENSSFVDYFN